MNVFLSHGWGAQTKELPTDTMNTPSGLEFERRACYHLRGCQKAVRSRLKRKTWSATMRTSALTSAAMNRGRAEPDYFTLLSAPWPRLRGNFPDRYFNHRARMLADLNAVVRERNTAPLPGESHDEEFSESDLSKLACWMATGSGKTPILHLNYYQHLHDALEQRTIYY